MRHPAWHHSRGAAPTHATTDAPAWFAGRIPDGWFTAPPSVSSDGDEILVVGSLADVELPTGSSEADATTARSARIQRFREDTREARMRVAEEAQALFGRQISWGVDLAGQRQVFTTHSTPIMTRLRMPDRQVLDTLIEAGVARSRSEALAWCVRLVGQHQDEWLKGLRDALSAVEKARGAGPDVH